MLSNRRFTLCRARRALGPNVHVTANMTEHSRARATEVDEVYNPPVGPPDLVSVPTTFATLATFVTLVGVTDCRNSFPQFIDLGLERGELGTKFVDFAQRFRLRRLS